MPRPLFLNFDGRRNLWYTNYTLYSKNHWLGYFPTKKEALKVRREAMSALPHIL